MKRIKVNSNFYLDEFVDPYTYFNEEDHGLSMVDNRLFDIAQLLRYHYNGPISINNWWWFYQLKKEDWTIDAIIKTIEKKTTFNGRKIYKWSGIRTHRCSIGSRLSAHKKGKAIDPKGNEIEFFKIVKNNPEPFYNLGLRRLEDIRITPGWLHMDTAERNTKPKSIRVVDLRKATQTIYF
jgi:hypothetical protein